MSDSTHTQGLLVSRGSSIYAADGKTPVADTCLNRSVADNDDANARRLMACWNACDDIPTELLEAAAQVILPDEPYSVVQAERDTLRAEVERLRGALQTYVGKFGDCGPAYDAACAALKDSAEHERQEGRFYDQ